MTEKPHDHERSPEWPHVREEFLKACPACAACGGTEDLNVHHIQPFHLHPELELDPANPGMAGVGYNTTTVGVYKDWTGAVFTASGRKMLELNYTYIVS